MQNGTDPTKPVSIRAKAVRPDDVTAIGEDKNDRNYYYGGSSQGDDPNYDGTKDPNKQGTEEDDDNLVVPEDKMNLLILTTIQILIRTLIWIPIQTQILI